MQQMAKRYPEMDCDVMLPFVHFLRTSSEMVQVVERDLARHGMAMGRMSVMMSLNVDPDKGTTPGEIAERCGVTAATITRLVDGLVAEGYVDRSADPNDRRSQRILLTDKGKRQLEGLLPEHFRLIRSLFSTFTAKEREQMTRLMDKLFVQLNTINTSES